MAGKLCQNYLYQIEWLTIEQLTWLLRVRVCVCEKFSFSFSNLSNVIINLQRARKSILAAILTILTIFRKWKTEKYEKKKWAIQ